MLMAELFVEDGTFIQYFNIQNFPDSLLRSGKFHPKHSLRILVIDLPQDLLRKRETVDSPPSLRWHTRRCVVEILILGFKEPVIDVIQVLAEHLLRRFRTERNRVGPKQNSILVFVEETR